MLCVYIYIYIYVYIVHEVPPPTSPEITRSARQERHGKDNYLPKTIHAIQCTSALYMYIYIYIYT